MSGTLSGGQNAAETNIRRYGPDYYKRIGKSGGKKSKRHLTHEEAVALGKLGGRPRGLKHKPESIKQMSASHKALSKAKNV